MIQDVLWRDTAITPKIFILDARAVFPLGLWLFHWAWWTAAVAGGGHCCPVSGATHGYDAAGLLSRFACGLHGQAAGDHAERGAMAATLPLVAHEYIVFYAIYKNIFLWRFA